MSRRGFEGNYSRRPANNNNQMGPGSLLGAPPSRGGGGGGRPWNNNDQQQQQISRNTGGGGGGRSNFSGGQGGGQGQGWRSPSPNRREPERDIWGTPQRFEVGGGVGGGGQMMYPNPKNQQQQQQPQVVMVQLPPQGNPSNSFMLQNQNPFGQQRQVPMQVILPAFDANIGQQIIQAQQQQAQVQGGNFGGGGGMNMNMNQQGMMMNQNQQRSQQQYNPFEQQMRGDNNHHSNNNNNNNVINRGDNFSRSSSGRIQRTSLGGGNNNGSFRSSTIGRRSESHLNNDSRPSPRTSFPSQILRGGRKRVGRDFVADVDRKRSRVTEVTEVINRRPTRYFPGKPNAGGNKASTEKKNFKPKVEANKGKAVTPAKTPAKTPAATAGKTKTPENKKEEVVKSSEEAAGDEKKEAETSPGKKDEKKKSKYDEFPSSLLVCKICQRSMNDGHSYESHLDGRAHLSLVKILEDRFQKRGELLKLESKLVEQEIAIEQDRSRRPGQKGHAGNKQKNFCKMCDCNYSTNWGAHKVSLNHRILKEFLHPNCRFCGDQFVHRMDWVNHLYSINHFKKVLELKQDGEDMDVHETFNQEELFAITIDMGENEARPMNALTIRSPNYKLTKPLNDDLKQLLKDHADIIIPDEGEVIIPSEFKEETPVGQEAITEVKGWICKLCRTYIANEKEVLTHCQQKRHFGIYTTHMKKLVQVRDAKKEAEKKAAAAKEAKELAAKKAQEKKEKDAEAKKNSGQESTTKTEGEEKKEEKVDDSTKDDIKVIEVEDGTGEETTTTGTGEEKVEEMETSTTDNDVSIIENGEEVKETEGKKEKEVPAAIKVQTPAKVAGTPAAAKSPTGKRGGRGGRGMPNPRFAGNRGRGGFTPQAKVVTTIGRGGRGTGGSGGAARTPSGRGTRGNWRGNK